MAGETRMPFDFTQITQSVETLAVFLATIAIAYAGFMLATSRDVQQRNEWKEILAGVIFGLILLFLAPFIASTLAGGNYCG